MHADRDRRAAYSVCASRTTGKCRRQPHRTGWSMERGGAYLTGASHQARVHCEACNICVHNRPTTVWCNSDALFFLLAHWQCSWALLLWPAFFIIFLSSFLQQQGFSKATRWVSSVCKHWPGRRRHTTTVRWLNGLRSAIDNIGSVSNALTTPARW